MLDAADDYELQLETKQRVFMERSKLSCDRHEFKRDDSEIACRDCDGSGYCRTINGDCMSCDGYGIEREIR